MVCVGYTSRVRNKYYEKQEILRNQTLCSPSWECPVLEGEVFLPLPSPEVVLDAALKDFRGALSSRSQLPEAEVS